MSTLADKLHIITEEKPVKPEAGWSVISLDYEELTNSN